MSPRTSHAEATPGLLRRLLIGVRLSRRPKRRASAPDTATTGIRMVQGSFFLRPLQKLAAAALALPLLAGAATPPALAEGSAAPLLVPARDVAVTYRLAGPGGTGAQEMRIAWLAAEGRLRLDLQPELGGVMVVDRRAQRVFMVMDHQRLVVELSPGGDGLPRLGELPPGVRLVREGDDRIAGVPCTVWRYQDRHQSGRACITADGVLLRASGAGATGTGDDGSIEAIAVAYGPQDPARFQPPSGYRSMRAALPAGRASAAVPARTAGR